MYAYTWILLFVLFIKTYDSYPLGLSKNEKTWDLFDDGGVTWVKKISFKKLWRANSAERIYFIHH